MSRKKSQKIKDVVQFQNVFTGHEKNVWQSLRTYFGNEKPCTLEIGCGYGEYTVEMARLYPERNFVGIDFKGARVYSGAKSATELNLKNAAFIVGGAEKLNEIFPSNSVEEIFLPFPDPHKTRTSSRRLVNENFLIIYKNILQEDSRVHLKTDNEELYLFTLEILKKENFAIHYSTADLYSEDALEHHLLIQTRYEKQYLSEGKKIKYICFGR